MSFASRMGIVLRRASGSSNSSLLQAVRCMSSSKLFVGGLSYATDDPTLRDAFSGYGDVLEARIIMDRESGRSKGFGFVTYASTEAAAAAISAMDGRVILEISPMCYCRYAMTFMPIVLLLSSAPLCKCSPEFQDLHGRMI
uniref:RRM domain-containing protein n=1 Tax=Aegilops tauschii subsp. strangulata TaxID=200361 RepID=A0A453B575_AEGTS